jgi:hypothetical protein
VATSEREAVMVVTTRGRLLQRLVGRRSSQEARVVRPRGFGSVQRARERNDVNVLEPASPLVEVRLFRLRIGTFMLGILDLGTLQRRDNLRAFARLQKETR